MSNDDLSDPELDAMARERSPSPLRPFTKDDWSAFAGCESETPALGELDCGLVILDGKHVQLMLEEAPGGAFGRDFETEDLALAAAEGILLSTSPLALAALLGLKEL